MTPRPERLYRGYAFDLDGTVYLGDALLPDRRRDDLAGSGRSARRTVFLSNNPTHPPEDYAAKLTRLGLPTDVGTSWCPPRSSSASSRQRMPGARLFVLGEAPLRQALAAAGFEVVDGAAGVEAVIASFDRTFAYPKLQVAFDAIRAGARFFATNGDRYCPVPGGGQPDAASIIAAIEACTGVACEAIVGKPSRHTSEAILRDAAACPPRDCLITGDRLETDVADGPRGGDGGALALTGATTEEMIAARPIRPTYVLHRLAELLPASVAAGG